MVTHIDMAKSKFAFNKFTLEELARVLKVSYGLARKYALEWVEREEVHKFKRSGAKSKDQFQFKARKLKGWDEPYVKDDAMEELIWQGEDLFPEGPTEEEIEEVVEHYLGPAELGELAPVQETTIEALLREIMGVSQSWKTRAQSAEQENQQIKVALAEFLEGLKAE